MIKIKTPTRAAEIQAAQWHFCMSQIWPAYQQLCACQELGRVMATVCIWGGELGNQAAKLQRNSSLWDLLLFFFVCLFVCLFVCFCFLGPHPLHMEVLRLGIKSELQLKAFATARAM